MDQILETVHSVYQSDLHQDFQSMAHLCDELRQLIVFIHYIGVSSTYKQKPAPASDSANPFQCRIDELAAEARNKCRYTPSSQVPSGMGRGARQFMSSIENSPIPSFSSRPTDMNGKAPMKVCSIPLPPLS